jgi:hypothetical protein
VFVVQHESFMLKVEDKKHMAQARHGGVLYRPKAFTTCPCNPVATGWACAVASKVWGLLSMVDGGAAAGPQACITRLTSS